MRTRMFWSMDGDVRALEEYDEERALDRPFSVTAFAFAAFTAQRAAGRARARAGAHEKGTS